MFNFKIKNEDSKIVVKFEGDLDIEATEIIEDNLTKALQETSDNVEIDFQDIYFVDSSGIGLLITLISDLKDKSIKPTIINLQEDVKTVFDLLQLDEILGKDVVVL